MSLLSKFRIMIALAVLSCPATLFAAAIITITPSGSSSYDVIGTGMDGVAGIQVNISYDANSLDKPSVTQGGLISGAMLAANTSLPGMIKVAIISTRAFSGSGQIASISFASKTGSGGITSITSKMIDINGAALPSTPVYQPAESPESPNSQPFQPSQTTPAGQTSSTSQAVTATKQTYLGTVTLPIDQQQRPTPQPPESTNIPVPPAEPASAKAAEKLPPSETTAAATKDSDESRQRTIYKGIIDRFKIYKGSRKFSDVAALFDRKPAAAIYQEPAIILTDGKSKVSISFEISSKTATSPNIAVDGGKLIYFKQDKDNKGRWLADILPEAGALRVIVTVIAGVDEFDFPLTAAPPVKTTLTLDEKGWKRFTREIGTEKAPMHDLNGDGVRDYIDDFIFIANCLSINSKTAKSEGSEKVHMK